MTNKYTLTDVRGSYKKKDAWWTVYLVDPIASRMILPLVNYTNISPNQITILAFIIGCIAAYCFYLGSYSTLLVGAVLYHISFIFDCMDGKISRLKGRGSIFGSWLDYILDRIRVAICAFTLMLGQFQQTGDVTFFYFAGLICFLDSMRYMNALLLYRSRNEMRKKIKKTKELQRKKIPVYKLKNTTWVQLIKDNQAVLLRNEMKNKKKLKVDFQREVVARFPLYVKISRYLLKRRVRLHLFSGIEYQMFIFIIGPLSGMMKEMVIFSSIMLFVFELLIIYKLWLNTLDFEQQVKKYKSPSVH